MDTLCTVVGSPQTIAPAYPRSLYAALLAGMLIAAEGGWLWLLARLCLAT
jgi:hypothetical protein